MSNKLQPISNTDFYLQAVLDMLIEIKNGLVDVETEIATLNKTLQSQKSSVILDAQKVADSISSKLLTKSKAR